MYIYIYICMCILYDASVMWYGMMWCHVMRCYVPWCDACMCACMHACMYVCVHVCDVLWCAVAWCGACMYAFMHLCAPPCNHARIYICVCTCIYIYIYIHIYKYTYTYVCIYMCIHIYIYIYINIYIYIYICLFACLCACRSACTHVFAHSLCVTHACMIVCQHLCSYTLMRACMYVCMCVCICVFVLVCMYVRVYVCMYVCLFVSVYVCMYVCIYACMKYNVCMYVCVSGCMCVWHVFVHDLLPVCMLVGFDVCTYARGSVSTSSVLGIMNAGTHATRIHMEVLFRCKQRAPIFCARCAWRLELYDFCIWFGMLSQCQCANVPRAGSNCLVFAFRLCNWWGTLLASGNFTFRRSHVSIRRLTSAIAPVNFGEIVWSSGVQQRCEFCTHSALRFNAYRVYLTGTKAPTFFLQFLSCFVCVHNDLFCLLLHSFPDCRSSLMNSDWCLLVGVVFWVWCISSLGVLAMDLLMVLHLAGSSLIGPCSAPSGVLFFHA